MKTFELQRHYFRLNLKSYSVDVNFHFELSKSDHLILGDIPTDCETESVMYIENCGVYSIAYRYLSSVGEPCLVLSKEINH